MTKKRSSLTSGSGQPSVDVSAEDEQEVDTQRDVCHVVAEEDSGDLPGEASKPMSIVDPVPSDRESRSRGESPPHNVLMEMEVPSDVELGATLSPQETLE